MTRIAVVGSRGFSDYLRMKRVLDALVVIANQPVVIVSGGATGADRLAERYARERGLELVVHRAEWKVYGKAAGPIRNKVIVDDSDLVVAFWDGLSAGTRSTISMANARLKPLHVERY